MRIVTLAFAGALGLAVTATAASAAPVMPAAAPPHAANIVPVSGGCGRGFHRDPWGYCIANRWGYYRPYAYRQPYWPGYYGDGYEPWNRPSPTDHVARQLNRQQLMYGY